MASKRRNMFYKNKKQETTEIDGPGVRDLFQYKLQETPGTVDIKFLEDDRVNNWPFRLAKRDFTVCRDVTLTERNNVCILNSCRGDMSRDERDAKPVTSLLWWVFVRKCFHDMSFVTAETGSDQQTTLGRLLQPERLWVITVQLVSLLAGLDSKEREVICRYPTRRKQGLVVPCTSSYALVQMFLLYLGLLSATWMSYIRHIVLGVYARLRFASSTTLINPRRFHQERGHVATPLPGSLPAVRHYQRLSESGDGVMVTLMDQQRLGPGDPQGHNESGPSAPVQDKGGTLPNVTSEPEQHQPHDDIPSFSEWTKKQIAEAEKNKVENQTKGSMTGGTGSGGGMKLRSKNYASPDCGAKVAAANPEATSHPAVLSPSRDEYILSPCNAKTWFIVELCESIQPQRIEVANFELFSSSPKEFSVHLSDRYPSREWTHAATIEAKDERTVQSFALPHLTQFAKFIKVEIHSHYGTEHYCPVSLFRAYGTSELEVLETVDEVSSGGAPEEEEIADEDLDTNGNDLLGGGQGIEEEEGPKNLFGSARDAVMSIVKKAAEVLVVKSGNANTTQCREANTTAAQTSSCVTPGYLVVCVNCTDNFFYKVYHLLCCHQLSFQSLLASPFVSKVLSETSICSEIGLDWARRGAPLPLRPRTSPNPYSPSSAYLGSLLPKETVTALCNMMAVSQRKVVLNVTRDASLSIESSFTEGVNISLPPPSLSGVSQSTTAPPSALPLPSGADLSDSSSPSTSLPPQPLPPLHQLDPSFTISPTKTLSPSEGVGGPAADVETAEGAALNSTGLLEGEKTQPLPAESPSGIASTQSKKLSATSASVEKEASESEGSSNGVVNETQSTIESTIEDPTTVDSLSLDSLLSDLEEETEAPTSTAKANTSPPQHVQTKESVFVRLANRIKALERNMSLSSQYLEELSRRYKKQVEELQRTLANMVEDRRLSAERESIQIAQLNALTQRVDTLTNRVSELITERESWMNKASLIGQHGLIILAEITVFVMILSVCRWLSGGIPGGSGDDGMKGWGSGRGGGGSSDANQVRRRSLDDIDSKPKQRKRRPSEEAMRISGSAHCDLLLDGVQKQKGGGGEVRRRKRRRKERPIEVVMSVGGGGETVANGNGPLELHDDWSRDPPIIDQFPVSQPLQERVPHPSPGGLSYVKTALWSRKQRGATSQSVTTSGSSQETISVPIATVKPQKKPGTLKKIVKKLF
ncbi:hypothetical protein AAG570_001556 [Ranatra chinensis]|uniref:SUN domain-containing protein n=1 Tax=Ranatra chinensis TaxID=642074 RepID=A0ABD0Y8U4_9HEMI